MLNGSSKIVLVCLGNTTNDALFVVLLFLFFFHEYNLISGQCGFISQSNNPKVNNTQANEK